MDIKDMTSKLQELVNDRFSKDEFGAPYLVHLKFGDQDEVMLSVSEGGVPHDHMDVPSIDGIAYAFLAAVRTFPEYKVVVSPRQKSAEKVQETMKVVL